LIVEVEEQLAENLKTFLGRSAVDVRVAPDADAAMVVLGSFAADLVVLDDELPGIDGLGAYDKIVRTCPKPPRCVLITSHLTDAVADRARQQGVCQILCKPFSFADLQHAINESMREMGDPVITSDRRVGERRRHLSLSRHLNRRLTWTRRDRQGANFPELNGPPANA
jgi:DNA-binding response OmpR family regulator